jgi:hypothetical protein
VRCFGVDATTPTDSGAGVVVRQIWREHGARAMPSGRAERRGRGPGCPRWSWTGDRGLVEGSCHGCIAMSVRSAFVAAAGPK